MSWTKLMFVASVYDVSTDPFELSRATPSLGVPFTDEKFPPISIFPSANVLITRTDPDPGTPEPKSKDRSGLPELSNRATCLYGRAVYRREVATDKYSTIGLYVADIKLRRIRNNVEALIDATVRIQPDDEIARESIKGCERSAHQDFSIRLNANPADKRVCARADIERLVYNSVLEQACNILDGHAQDRADDPPTYILSPGPGSIASISPEPA